jgi:hypothetical protein
MTITLEHIEAKQSEIQQLIARFKAEQPRALQLSATTVELAQGEVYAGVALGDDGNPSHHLVLLPGEVDDVSWTNAQDWAEDQGGHLPTRREQALLFANCKQHFQTAGYWSGQQHDSESSWAWYQYFGYGGQYYGSQSYGLRARAVRRLVIE